MLTGANANLAQHLASRPATAFRVPCSIQLQQKPARASFYGTKRSQRPRLAHNDDVQKQSFARAVGKGLSCRTTDVALPIRTRPARRQCIVRAASSAASPGTSPAQAAPESAKPPYYLHSWRWRGHKINYAVRVGLLSLPISYSGCIFTVILHSCWLKPQYLATQSHLGCAQGTTAANKMIAQRSGPTPVVINERSIFAALSLEPDPAWSAPIACVLCACTLWPMPRFA